MKRQILCPVCGKEFTAIRVTQRFCSTSCRLWSYRHNPRSNESTLNREKVIRTFQCLKCGRIVYVADPADRRTKFCSSHCERLYWKHSEKVRPKAVNRTFRCRQCGKVVHVTEPKDRRTAFCSDDCRNLWVYLERRRQYKLARNKG